MSSKKLLEQCQKLEKLWGHVLTGKYFYFGTQHYKALQSASLQQDYSWKYKSQTNFHQFCRDSPAALRELVPQGD